MEENVTQLIIVTAVLALAHSLAPWILKKRARVFYETESFAGGMAAAYVFLHLLPEIDVRHDFFGDRIYIAVLAGFALFYGSEVAVNTWSTSGRHSFALRLLLTLTYSMLIGYTLGEQLPADIWATILFSIAIGLHFITVGNGLHRHFKETYLAWRTPWLLALSTLAGSALSWFTGGSEATIDMITATIVGFMLFIVIRDEIPDTRSVRFRWFVSGMGVITASFLFISR